MKNLLRSLPALLALPAALFATESAKSCGCSCCPAKEACCSHDDASAPEVKPAPESKSAEANRHPLKGIVIDVRSAKQSLLVKHEAIPGYMMAMTMLLRVDAATLKAVKPGDAIAATLVEEKDGFRLENIQIVRN